MSPRQPIEVQRGLVASLDRHDAGAGSAPTPRAERQSGPDRERRCFARPAGARPRIVSSTPRTAATSCNAASAGSGAPRPRASIRRATTPADYFAGGHSDGYADYLGAEPVLRREFARTVEFIRRYCPRGRLLDVGCAYGFFLQEAKPFFEVAGIELAEEAAAHGRQSGLNVVTGVADESTLAQLGAHGRHRPARRDRASAEPARHARAVRPPSQSGRHHRHHDRRFRLAVGAACRCALAADDAAAASVVLLRREHAADGGARSDWRSSISTIRGRSFHCR